MSAPPADPEAAVERAARQSYGRLLAYVAARTRDLAAAEDALAEAFAAALAVWPREGVPRSPEAWLLTVARRRASDTARRRRNAEAGGAALPLIAATLAEASAAASEIPDERLRLMFTCAHPAIEAEARAPLVLQAVLGFDAARIAAAFLVAPAAMSQRLVRAKRKIRDAGIPFAVPGRDELPARLDAVLEAVYAVFAEGWSDPGGTIARSRGLAEEAIWLGRLIVSLMPEEPEALGLLALMLHAEARRPARRDMAGAYVPLAEQDPKSWHADMIEEAEILLLRASQMDRIGRFQLEAALQSAHAARRNIGKTDWAAIVALYDALLAFAPSPVAAINRAVAVGELGGPQDGLAALDALSGDRRLALYQPYWAARAALLARAGDTAAMDDAYSRAIGLEPDPAVRRFLEEQRSSSRRA